MRMGPFLNYLWIPSQSPGQMIATFQCNIVACSMLGAFGHPVTTCCDMLVVVGSNLKMVKFFMQHLWMLHDVLVVLPGSCHNVAPRYAHWFDFQYPTCCNTSQQVGQTCATCCAEQCCNMLYSNVAIVWPELANTRPTML